MTLWCGERQFPCDVANTPMKRTLAIGDIHGCNIALTTLLARVSPQAEDVLVFLGDYIDRGPASKQVLDSLLALQSRCSTVFLRGNHEVMILDGREDPLKAANWMTYGGFEALISYGAEYEKNWAAAIPQPHWDFLAGTHRYFETETHIFVHACLDPELPLAEQPDWFLFWESFQRIKPHCSGKQIICGHTPLEEVPVRNQGFAVCIDTRAVTGGWLTGLDVHSGKYWQADEDGNEREGALE